MFSFLAISVCLLYFSLGGGGRNKVKTPGKEAKNECSAGSREKTDPPWPQIDTQRLVHSLTLRVPAGVQNRVQATPPLI